MPIGMPNPFTVTQRDVALNIEKYASRSMPPSDRRALLQQEIKRAAQVLNETKQRAEVDAPLPPVYFREGGASPQPPPGGPGSGFYWPPRRNEIHTDTAAYFTNDIATLADSKFAEMVQLAQQIATSGSATPIQRQALEEALGAYQAFAEIVYPKSVESYHTHRDAEHQPEPLRTPGAAPRAPIS
jgi:hypothetical protein